MYLEHETGRKRKLDAVADLAVETDEQLARRLHEELNSLTRHGSRRVQTAVYAEQRPHASKADKAAGTHKLSKHGVAPAVDSAIKSEPSADVGAAAVAEAEGSEAQQDRLEKPRKRSVLNRELAMLVTDMVESHVKPVTGARSKVKDGSESLTDQQDHDRQGLQQDQQQEDHITAVKHESSSSLSEQERLAVEHLHAAGPEALVNKVLVVQHTSIRLPMVLYGKKWYRARVMEQGDSKVLLEYQGFSHEGGPFWLAKDHPRIWRGSYKGKDWRYLGDGAWEPKASKHDAKARQGKGKGSKGTAADSYSHHNQQPLHHHHHHCHRHGSAAVTEDVPLSPRGYGGRQGNGRRRGHNWSKPLTRPPRAPVGQQHQQHMGALLGRRHSLNGSTTSHPQLMYGSTDLCNGLMAREAAMATSPRVSRQGSLVSSPGNAAGVCSAGGHRGSDPFLLGADSDSKQQVLRHLLNAVGEMQANSGRPDLMFPLQYGGVPLGSSEQPGSHAKSLQLSMQSHLAMPAAAAALLAAVPSLDTVQHMAALHCSLNANLPSLFH
eukprot:gene11518-11661_t